MTKKFSKTLMTAPISTSKYGGRTTVIFARGQQKQKPIFLLISLTVLSCSSFHTFCDQRLGSLSNTGNFEDLGSEIVPGRTKQWASELEAQQSNRQQQIIPAANPNFEAAFQGECGKNNNSNPCGHICLDLYDGTYECSCFYGFTLAVDGYSCTPVVHTTSTAAPSSSPFPPSSLAEQDKKERLASPSTTTTTITTTTSTISTTTPSTATKQSVTLQAKALGLGASFVRTSASSDGSVISPVEEKTSDLIERSANDNRKLADESARGVKLRNIGRNGKITGIKASSDESEVLRRQRRLLGATASSLHKDEKRETKKEEKRLNKINYPPSFSIKYSSGINYSEQKQLLAQQQQPRLYEKTGLSDEKEFTTNIVTLQRPAVETAITGSSSSSGTSDNQNNKADTKLSLTQPTQTQARKITATFSFDSKTEASSELNKSSLNRLYDLELKSIILENDKLLDQLAHSISKSLNSYEELQTFTPNSSDSWTESNSKYDQEISLLEELVRETIQDYKLPSLAAAAIPSQASSDWRLKYSLVGNSDKLLEETQSTTRGDNKINEASRENRSSSTIASASLGQQQSVRLIRADSEKEEDRDEFVVQDLVCANRTTAQKYENSADTPGSSYRNCAEHPECESGGQCTELNGLYARCRCPVGRGGNFCQKPISNLNVPKFSGLSYLAVPMITEPELISLRLVFKPQQQLENKYNLASRLLLYSQGKFTLLLDSMNRIELRYSSGRISEDEDSDDEYNSLMNENRNQVKVTRVFGSRDARENEWNELIVTSDASFMMTTTKIHSISEDETEEDEDEDEKEEEGEEDANDIDNRIVLVTPDRIQLKNRQKDGNFTELFLGGLPDNNNSINALETANELESTAGFSGCIKGLNINGRVYSFSSNFDGDTLDGFDIAECCNLKFTQ